MDLSLFFRIPQDDGKCAVKERLKDIPPPFDPLLTYPDPLLTHCNSPSLFAPYWSIAYVRPPRLN
jgi:hypothetical protein